MKTPMLWLLLLLVSTLAYGAPFEGRLHLRRAEPPGEPHDIIYSIKGDKVRVEVIRDRVNSFLTDTTKQETTAILEDDMAYLTMSSLAPVPGGPRLEKTDEKTSILGHPAQKYLLSSDEGTTELWLAEGFGKYTGFGEGYEKPPQQLPNIDVAESPLPWAWEYALAGQPLCPLRVITRDSIGTELFRLEVKAISPSPLSEGLFRPSSNYKQLETWPETPRA